jgi:nicotinamidase-related amidase
MKKLIAYFALCLTSITMNAQNKDKALLVIDIQDFYFKGGRLELHEPEKAAANAALLIDRFRNDSLPVIYIQHKSKEQMGIHELVKPKESEKIFVKTEINSFNGTGLKAYLDSLGIKSLVICGMQTHMCVEAATRAAYDFGYKVQLISDACTTRDLKWEDSIIEWDKVHNSTLVTLLNYAQILTTQKYLEENK